MNTITSVITNDFRGWQGDSVFVLQNGQVWQQRIYKYRYFYAYRPKVTIVYNGNFGTLTVLGHSVDVKRLQ